MTKISVLVLAAALQFAGVALASDVAHLAWNRSNVDALRSFDKAAVVGFLDGLRRSNGGLQPVTFGEVGQFQWADLAGDGTYRLVVTRSGPCAHYVEIFTRNITGQISSQSIEGWADLRKAIRDLNGDGKDELIVQKLLIQYDCGNTVVWPAVYRLKDSKYVEASRDFPEFYDREVLPTLERRISEYQVEGRRGQVAAEATMMRDKILRVLGRNPTAGLRQAQEWMKSDDPDLLRDAGITFQEIGGHEEELRAVVQALAAARKRGVEPYDPRLREDASRGGEPNAYSGGGQPSPESAPNAAPTAVRGPVVHWGGAIR